jgi:hypothetical protein
MSEPTPNSAAAQLLAALASSADNWVKLLTIILITVSGWANYIITNHNDYTQIFGTGIYSNPNGLEWLAVAVNSGVWFTRDGEYPQFLPLSENLTVPVNFSQAYRSKLSPEHRGIDEAFQFISNVRLAVSSAQKAGTRLRLLRKPLGLG